MGGVGWPELAPCGARNDVDRSHRPKQPMASAPQRGLHPSRPLLQRIQRALYPFATTI